MYVHSLFIGELEDFHIFFAEKEQQRCALHSSMGIIHKYTFLFKLFYFQSTLLYGHNT